MENFVISKGRDITFRRMHNARSLKLRAITQIDRRASHRIGSCRGGGILHFFTSTHPDRAAFCKRTDASSSGNSRKVNRGVAVVPDSSTDNLSKAGLEFG